MNRSTIRYEQVAGNESFVAGFMVLAEFAAVFYPVLLSFEKLCEASIAAANAVNDLEVVQEPFHSFADKICTIVASLPKSDQANQTKMLSALQSRYKEQLRFQGKPLNKTMLSSAIAVNNCCPAESKAQRSLYLLGMWYPAIWKNYSRLYKATNLVSNFLQNSNGVLGPEDSLGFHSAFLVLLPLSTSTVLPSGDLILLLRAVNL